MAQNSLSFFHGQSGWLLDPSLPGQGAGFLMVLLVTTSQFLETKLWLWPHAGPQPILSVSLLQLRAPDKAAINMSDPVIMYHAPATRHQTVHPPHAMSYQTVIPFCTLGL